jgi:hypothetical protein
MDTGFVVKAWDKLVHSDRIQASLGDYAILGTVDGQPDADSLFVTERDGTPVLVTKNDGWEVRLRSL